MKNAVNMLRHLLGKNAVQLNKGNIALRNACMSIGIEDPENVDSKQFEDLLNKYIEKSKVKPEILIEDWTFESLDDTWNGQAKSTVQKKGTVTQAKAYIEMLGKTAEFLEWINK